MELEYVLSDYTVVDLETTGLSPEKHKIIEIGALKIRNNEIVDTYTTLVNPGCHIDSQATRVNNITDDTVKNAPKIEQVIQDTINFIGDDIILGHNISFDVNFLRKNYFNCTGKELNNDTVDTCSLSKRCVYVPNYKLDTLIEYFGIPEENNHRALQDCKATYELYKKLCNYDASVEDLERLRQKGKKKTVSKPAVCKEPSDCLFDVDYGDDNPFYDKSCVVSGELERMTRDEIKELVTKMGGHFKSSVSKKTDFLILGDYNELTKLMMKGEKSTKLLKAEELNSNGGKIDMINESDFFSMIEKYVNSNDANDDKQSNSDMEKTNFVFLGSLAGIIRLDAAHIIDCLGGELKDAVSGNTDYLVIGDYDESKKTDLDKLAKFDEVKEKGKTIHKISVSEFLAMIDTDKELDYIPVKSIFDYINDSLSARYKKTVILSLKESADGKTVHIRATAKETAWHQELANKTILKIDFNNILLPKASKAVLNDLNVSYDADEKSEACCVDIKYFMTLSSSAVESIFVDALVKSFAFSAFGCCSKYSECNEKLKCVHDDVLYSNACQHKTFLLSQLKLRRKYGLPVTKKLQYFDRNFSKFEVVKISVDKPFTDCCVMRASLDNGNSVKINSDYLCEMQKPDFESTHKI